jgi:hypothetical protein
LIADEDQRPQRERRGEERSTKNREHRGESTEEGKERRAEQSKKVKVMLHAACTIHACASV